MSANKYKATQLLSGEYVRIPNWRGEGRPNVCNIAYNSRKHLEDYALLHLFTPQLGSHIDFLLKHKMYALMAQ